MALKFCFLRAINVGKRRITMSDLSTCLMKSGLKDVETFIASGNFVFSGDISEQKIEQAIQAQFGFLAEAFVRTRAEVAALHELTAPLMQDQKIHAVQVGFIRDAPDDEVRSKLTAVENDLDMFSYGPREIVWTAYDRMSETPFGKKGMTGKGWPICTFRNVTTLGKMLDKWG